MMDSFPFKFILLVFLLCAIFLWVSLSLSDWGCSDIFLRCCLIWQAFWGRLRLAMDVWVNLNKTIHCIEMVAKDFNSNSPESLIQDFNTWDFGLQPTLHAACQTPKKLTCVLRWILKKSGFSRGFFQHFMMRKTQSYSYTGKIAHFPNLSLSSTTSSLEFVNFIFSRRNKSGSAAV